MKLKWIEAGTLKDVQHIRNDGSSRASTLDQLNTANINYSSQTSQQASKRANVWESHWFILPINIVGIRQAGMYVDCTRVMHIMQLEARQFHPLAKHRHTGDECDWIARRISAYKSACLPRINVLSSWRSSPSCLSLSLQSSSAVSPTVLVL